MRTRRTGHQRVIRGSGAPVALTTAEGGPRRTRRCGDELRDARVALGAVSRPSTRTRGESVPASSSRACSCSLWVTGANTSAEPCTSRKGAAGPVTCRTGLAARAGSVAWASLAPSSRPSGESASPPAAFAPEEREDRQHVLQQGGEACLARQAVVDGGDGDPCCGQCVEHRARLQGVRQAAAVPRPEGACVDPHDQRRPAVSAADHGAHLRARPLADPGHEEDPGRRGRMKVRSYRRTHPLSSLMRSASTNSGSAPKSVRYFS